MSEVGGEGAQGTTYFFAQDLNAMKSELEPKFYVLPSSLHQHSHIESW